MLEETTVVPNGVSIKMSNGVVVDIIPNDGHIFFHFSGTRTLNPVKQAGNQVRIHFETWNDPHTES